MKRRTVHILLACAALFVVATPRAHAYRLPRYAMTPEDRARPAEEALARTDEALARIRSEVPRTALADTGRSRRAGLSRSARRALASYDGVREAHAFWDAVVRLKHDLVALYGAPAPEAIEEADSMAKIVIQTIYDLSQEYEITGSALIQNFLINRGFKQKGFCYHYVNDLRTALSVRPWRRFEVRWGEAWAGTFRENNALVITAAGAPFASGIAVDAWRTAGKPFWTAVRGDRFPWTEAFDVVIEGKQ